MFENLLSVGGLSMDRLKSFLDVAEKGAIARVAEGDPSRQSLISRQIGELEAFFGTELTRRKGKGLELTDVGLELARQVRLQFQGLQDFKAACSGRPVEFRLAAGNSILEWLVTPVLGKVAAAVPGATFALLDWRTGDVVRGLLNHTLDLGIVRKSAVVRPLKFKPLGRFEYRLFVPKGRDGKKSKKPENMPIAISIGGEFLRTFEDAAAKADAKLNVAFRCTSFTLAAQLVKSGVSAAILPEIAAASIRSEATPIDLPWMRGITRDIGICWNSRLEDLRPGGGLVRKALTDALAESLTGQS